MSITANNPDRKSWIEYDKLTHFPVQNIPFGVFTTAEEITSIGTRIGETVIDLAALHQLGYFEKIELNDDVFLHNNLNEFIALGKNSCRAVRNRLAELFDSKNNELQNNVIHKEAVLHEANKVRMELPVQVGDYTDFYASKEHATNVGTMFRGKENALMPNWLHLPVGYHGRSSSIIPSGTPIHRPKGQTLPLGAESPVFGPSTKVDFELEMAFITTNANALGEQINIEDAEKYIFGMVLFNDWSARDIQKWEYVPLGPFLGKNFASSISPWIVTMDALEPFRVSSPKQNPTPLPYLQSKGNNSFDLHLDVGIKLPNGILTTVCQSNFKYMYWNMAQQLTHHTINGCPVKAGDMMGSGTISGPTPSSYGSMLELAWKGEKPISLKDGSERIFIHDFDTVVMSGYGIKNNIRIGFGEVSNKLLPAK